MKEFRRHGEAASINLSAVETERERLASILAAYQKEDQWNFDETGLFGL